MMITRTKDGGCDDDNNKKDGRCDDDNNNKR